jgi:hypothetical protein
MEEGVLYGVKSYRWVAPKLDLVKEMYSKNSLQFFVFIFP